MVNFFTILFVQMAFCNLLREINLPFVVLKFFLLFQTPCISSEHKVTLWLLYFSLLINSFLIYEHLFNPVFLSSALKHDSSVLNGFGSYVNFKLRKTEHLIILLPKAFITELNTINSSVKHFYLWLFQRPSGVGKSRERHNNSGHKMCIE